MLTRFVLAMTAEPWSIEFRICIAAGAGVALGVLLATGGTVH